MFPRLALARRLPCLRGSKKTAGPILASRFRSIHSSSLGLESPSFDVSLVKNDQAGLNIVFQGDSLPANLPGTKLSDTRTSLYLPDFWLRDNCRCSGCVNSDTKQRNFDTFKIDHSVRPLQISQDADTLHVKWSDGHLSVHPWPWLLSVVSRPSTDLTHAWTSGKRTWDASVSDHRPPDVSYDAVMATDGGRPAMAQLMQTLCEYGFAFVKDSPASPAATESLLSRIGPIRNTHYGGFYDFVPDLASADTAYTNLALAAHTDTTYFSDPAGLQSFHMLSHHPPPRKQQQQQEEEGGAPLGGRSLLVDGFRAAVEMRERWPEHFDTLRSLGIPWHASGNDDASITPDRRYPVIETLGGQLDAPIRRVRWNNDDRGVVPPDSADRWYAAARKWDSLLKDPANEFWFQLTPDRVLIFDNWRVLHGRSAFEGVRRICGGYINRDDYHSQWKISCHPRENVERYNLTQR